jgi:hypothetical protein
MRALPEETVREGVKERGIYIYKSAISYKFPNFFVVDRIALPLT